LIYSAPLQRSPLGFLRGFIFNQSSGSVSDIVSDANKFFHLKPWPENCIEDIEGWSEEIGNPICRIVKNGEDPHSRICLTEEEDESAMTFETEEQTPRRKRYLSYCSVTAETTWSILPKR
jgi:hypothetical protein